MKLSSISTCAPDNLDKEEIKAKTALLREKIAGYQKILFAENKRSLLIIIQGVDASGKDGLIAGVFTGLNPLGVKVAAFKAPGGQEARHDFLWRIHLECPPRGMIQLFNRSHYEDILVPYVNETLEGSALKHRIEDVNAFEKILRHSGTTILKFYLHISRDEQLKRLQERKRNPAKYWKHNDDDWEQRKKWKRYNEAYELLFRKCNEPEWSIIPSDQNWYKEYLVADIVYKTMRKMNLEYPPLVTNGK